MNKYIYGNIAIDNLNAMRFIFLNTKWRNGTFWLVLWKEIFRKSNGKEKSVSSPGKTDFALHPETGKS